MKTVFILASLLFAVPALSQDSGAFGPPAQRIEFEPQVIETPADWRENLRRTTQNLRQADSSLRAYVRASMEALMQGHRRGVAEFETWYRRRDAAARREAAQRQTLAKVFGSGLSTGLSIMVPGSGAFVSALRAGLTTAYGQAVNRLAAFDGGDPDIFIAEQKRALEEVNSSFLARADSIPDAEPEAFETLKWEYVFDLENDPTSTETDPRPRVRALAAHYGVPRPDAATIERTALTVLEAHISAALSEDRAFLRGNSVDMMHSREQHLFMHARLMTYRHFYAGQPDRYCPVEISLFGIGGLLGAGAECVRWQRHRN